MEAHMKLKHLLFALVLSGCKQTTVIVNPEYKDSEVIKKLEKGEALLWYSKEEHFSGGDILQPAEWNLTLQFGTQKISSTGRTLGEAYTNVLKEKAKLCATN